MNVVISIAVILAAISFAAMCGYIIVTLMAVRKVLDTITGHVGNAVGIIGDVSAKVNPLLESATGVTNKAQELVDSASELVDTASAQVKLIGGKVGDGIDQVMSKVEHGAEIVDNSLQRVDHMVGRITDFEAKVQDKVQRPVIKAFSAVAGVTKAVGAFYSSLRDGKQGHNGTTGQANNQIQPGLDYE